MALKQISYSSNARTTKARAKASAFNSTVMEGPGGVKKSGFGKYQDTELEFVKIKSM